MHHCMVCMNVCLKKCIEYGKKAKVKNRYFRNEYIK